MKNILLTALMLISATVIYAQGVFSIGPKVGYNSYQLTDNFTTINADIKNSFQVGAFIRVGSKVYFQPEANYQVSESTLSQNVGELVQSQDVTLKSLKVPALLGCKLINTKAFNLRLLAGPAVTFILNKELSPSTMDELWPIHSADDLKNRTWSVQTGAGFDVFFFTIDVRYEIGMDNIYNGSSDLQLKSNNFNVSLGVKFL